MLKPYALEITINENETCYVRNEFTEPLYRKLKKRYGSNIIINILNGMACRFVTVKEVGRRVTKSIISEFSKLLNLPAGNYEIGYVKVNDDREYNIIFLPEGKYTICEEISEDIISNLINR